MSNKKEKIKESYLTEVIFFKKQLLSWFYEAKRPLPWRKYSDPYPIWLSEIILQQTRVSQGIPYWKAFMNTFPNIAALAKAEEQQVLRLWQGLGYYARAKNLHTTAKIIYYQMGGKFPDAYKELIKLKGIGSYTAAAIASICFHEPVAAVDGNVFRFAARFFGIEEDISKASTRRIFENKLNEIVPKRDPGVFNQAMMEFGATICTPKPTCNSCIFEENCYAARSQRVSYLPIKLGKTKNLPRYFTYLVFTDGKRYLMNQRQKKDVWQGLYDFYLLEGNHTENDIRVELQKYSDFSFVLQPVYPSFKHILTHQTIYAKFYFVNADGASLKKIQKKTRMMCVSYEKMLSLPKSMLIVKFIKSVFI